MSDLINRGDVKNLVWDELNHDGMAYRIMLGIDKLPSAERVGKWEMKSDPYGFFDEIPVCSECGCTTKMREKTNYCPNCGARMESDKW